MKHWNLDIIGYWVIGAGCQIKKGLELISSPLNCSKDSSKLFPLLISINWQTSGEFISCGSKDIFKNAPCLT